MTPEQNQKRLLDEAGQYLAGGGTGLFVLPADLNLIVARGKGSRVWDVAGREYTGNVGFHLFIGLDILHLIIQSNSEMGGKLHDALGPELDKNAADRNQRSILQLLSI